MLQYKHLKRASARIFFLFLDENCLWLEFGRASSSFRKLWKQWHITQKQRDCLYAMYWTNIIFGLCCTGMYIQKKIRHTFWAKLECMHFWPQDFIEVESFHLPRMDKNKRINNSSYVRLQSSRYTHKVIPIGQTDSRYSWNIIFWYQIWILRP